MTEHEYKMASPIMFNPDLIDKILSAEKEEKQSKSNPAVVVYKFELEEHTKGGLVRFKDGDLNEAKRT